MTRLEIYSSHFTYKDPGKDRYLTDIYISIPEDQIKKMDYFSLDTIEVICKVSRNKEDITKGWHCFSLKLLKGNLNTKNILDVFTVALDKGNYQYDVKVYPRDRRIPIFGKTGAVFSIDEFDKNIIVNSDILISDRISKPPKTSDRFVKSGLWVQPFPRLEFSPEQPLLYYYWEVGNISDRYSEKYNILASIKDLNGKQVKKLSSPHHVIKNKKVIFFAGQNIIALKAGEYSLNLEVYIDGKPLVKQAAVFSMFKKPKLAFVDSISSQIDSMFLHMPMDEINDEIKIIRPIMKQKTFEAVCKMNQISKKVALSQFWKANDYIPETQKNEFSEYYHATVEYVREAFNDTNFNIDGVDTDMGRVVLQYGKPDVVNRSVDDTMAGTDVELWKIFKFQAYFLFVQEDFVGPHRLVHSTMRGEIRNPKWAHYLEANPELLDY